MLSSDSGGNIGSGDRLTNIMRKLQTNENVTKQIVNFVTISTAIIGGKGGEEEISGQGGGGGRERKKRNMGDDSHVCFGDIRKSRRHKERPWRRGADCQHHLNQ